MHNENIRKLKKYLFYISMLFVVLTSIHIINTYLYNDSEIQATEGWSISEWFIWEFPHLNPLIASNDYNSYINSYLYRSLLKYDVEEKKFKWDLAQCDISKFDYVECYLNDNIKWSNWEDITTKDILSTYNILKTLNLNPNISSILENTTIEERAWVIIFSNRKENVNFLNILLQPIVSRNILDNISSKELKGNFNPFDWVYSGKYIVENISYDETLWIKKLILTKNLNYPNNDVLITRIIFKFFKDVSHFLKHKDSINVFLDNDKIISWTIPRLNKYDFTLPQYFSLFLNSAKLKDKDFRNLILNNINVDNILSSIWSDSYKKIENPYLTDISIEKEAENKNIEWFLKDLWFFKKDNLLDASIEEEKEKKENELFNENNSDLKYIISPITKKFNFLSDDNILIKWNILDKAPYNIYINDYKLQSYKKWTKEFFYRLQTSYWNIKEWTNKYSVYFENEGEKELIEEFTIVYYKDEKTLEENKKEFISKFIKDLEDIDIEEEIIEEKEKEIKELDNNFYYNSENETYKLNLLYIDSQKESSIIVNNIKDSLETIWIWVDITPISIWALNELLKSWEKNYDMILVGINLWYFDFNIFPYFHSSQVKNGYNFANIKKPSLDLPLEELKSNILHESKIKDLEDKVLEILKEEQVVKTLFTPIISNLVDNNIYWYELSDKLPDLNTRMDSINKSFVTSEKDIIFEEKWLFDFIGFIIDIFRKDVNND